MSTQGMIMDNASLWRKFFVEWPSGIPQQGVVVTSFGEQVSFVGFLLSEHLVMFERRAPDSVGGRRLLLPYGKIDGIKIVDPVKNEVFSQAGFRAVSSPDTATIV
jgi:hypothetical protein